ncbi:MAG: c-type cytochrome domain-containing protein [Bacteroidia bacterium]|nr:c-type cytochrome domain-containing protein [Bacteroidia bacterium]
MIRLRQLILPLGCIALLILWSLASCVHDPVLPDPVDTIPPDTVPNDTVPQDTVPDDTVVLLPCSPDSVYFAQEILPVLVSNCAMSGCHDDVTRSDGFSLTSYANVMASGEVKPGNPADSDLFTTLSETDPDRRMPRPPAAPLPQFQIDLIGKWIQQGAKDLSCSNTSCDTAGVTFSGFVQPLIQSNCIGCHRGAAAGGGIRLETHAQVQVVSLNGNFFGAINHQPGFVAMPIGAAKLPACTLLKVKTWISKGALNN